MKKSLSSSVIAMAFFCLIFYSCQTKNDLDPSSIKELQIDKIEKNAIIGGQTINITDAPYQVAIYLNGVLNGGGVIINKDWVLTAAHVVTAFSPNTPPMVFLPSSLQIRSGNSNRNLATSHSISEIHIHPSFPVNNGFFQPNDIALVRLTNSLTFSDSQKPISYTSKTNDLSVNDIVTVSGWGKTICNNNSIPDILKNVSFPIGNLSNPSLISATSLGSSAYEGDSGGPLVRNFPNIGETLVGIVNAGTCSNGSHIYARVSYFSNWIFQTSGVSSNIIYGNSSICTEEIYTIDSNPYSVILENANGIATLSDLGNGQYKVTKVGSASGVITIKATSANGDVFDKNIRIGPLEPLAINGPSNPLNWSNNYIYTVDTSNPNDVLEIEKSGASQVIFTRLTNNSFRITTPAQPSSPGPVSKVYLVNINARVVSNCGNSDYISKEIHVGTSVPFE